jgi:hypothetical protein
MFPSPTAEARHFHGFSGSVPVMSISLFDHDPVDSVQRLFPATVWPTFNVGSEF